MSYELKDRIESNIVRKTFNIHGVPEKVWNELDDFCRENYGDARWLMIKDLMDYKNTDFKYEMLFGELEALKAEMAVLKQSPSAKSGTATFGGFGNGR